MYSEGCKFGIDDLYFDVGEKYFFCRICKVFLKFSDECGGFLVIIVFCLKIWLICVFFSLFYVVFVCVGRFF